MAAKTKGGVDSAGAQKIVEDTVKNATPEDFISLSPASAESFKVKVCDILYVSKTNFFKKHIFQATVNPAPQSTSKPAQSIQNFNPVTVSLPAGGSGATTTIMSMAASFVIFMMH